MQVVYGPTIPSAGSIIYQVTLSSGAIVTNPHSFGDLQARVLEPRVIVAVNGRVLAPAVDRAAREIWGRLEAIPGLSERLEHGRAQLEAGQRGKIEGVDEPR